LAIECHRNSKRYLALEIQNPSPMEGYPDRPVPWRRDVSARDSGGLKSQFMRSMRSAKRPRRCRQQSVSQLSACSRPMRVSHLGRILPPRFMAAGGEHAPDFNHQPGTPHSAPPKASPPGPSPTAQARSPAAPRAPFPRRPVRGRAGARPSPPTWHARAPRRTRPRAARTQSPR
jgi:hypothetical protein